MQRIDRNTKEFGVESMFKVGAQGVDDNHVQLVREA